MSTDAVSVETSGRLPGNPMMWILIGSEIAVFGVALAAFQVARIFDPDVFSQSQRLLDRWAGTANTAILITSGFLAALAVESVRTNALRRARLLLGGAALLGAVFLAVKTAEYAGKIQAGITTDTNTFFMLYYLVTGFHALHVLFGIVLLGVAAVWTGRDTTETMAAFWHMVDLVWLLIFPVIYLAP